MKRQILSEQFRRMQKLAGIINEDQYKEIVKEADEVDFKLTELKNEKVSELKKVMVEKGLKVTFHLAGKEYKYKASTAGSGWDAKSGNDMNDSYVRWNGEPDGVILVGIGKDTNKAQDILKFIENTFKEGYTIEKGGSASYWEIKIKPN